MTVDPLEHSHQPDEIAKRIAEKPNHSYLADFIYGAIDGTVTTFAIVSGVAGAGLSSDIIIILGFANLLGDGFSMAASNFLGTRTDQQLLESARHMEETHITRHPAGEREEIRQIFAAKGFAGADLERVVDVITADDKRWVDTMLTEELGLALHRPSAFRAAMTTFAAFVIIGFIPLLSFVSQLFSSSVAESAYLWSTLLTATAFFCVGAAKSLFVKQSWWLSGSETLLIGGIAASLAYAVGAALRHIIVV